MTRKTKTPVSEQISQALLTGAAPVAAVTTATTPGAGASRVRVSNLATLSLANPRHESGPGSNDNVVQIASANQTSLSSLGLIRSSGLKLSKDVPETVAADLPNTVVAHPSLAQKKPEDE